MKPAIFTDRQIELVRQSYAIATTDIEAFSKTLHRRMTAQSDDVAALFRPRETRRSSRFIRLLDTIVGGLDVFHILEEPLRRLGSDHDHFGVDQAHYAALSRALIETLTLLSGETWTKEHQRAWRSVMMEIVARLRDGATRGGRKPLAA